MTRGIRNNNPFNIRRSANCWLGKIPYSLSSDRSFEQFETMDHGIRAAIIILRNYILKHKIFSVRHIIMRWAPACENDVQRYLANIEALTVGYGTPITAKTLIKYGSTEFFALMRAMAKIESQYIMSEHELYRIIKHFNLYKK